MVDQFGLSHTLAWRAHIWQVERLAKQKQELKKEWNRAAWQSRCQTTGGRWRCFIFTSDPAFHATSFFCPHETTETKHVLALEDDFLCAQLLFILDHKNGSFPCHFFPWQLHHRHWRQGDVVPGRNAWPRALLHATDWRGQGAKKKKKTCLTGTSGPAGKRSSHFNEIQ